MNRQNGAAQFVHTRIHSGFSILDIVYNLGEPFFVPFFALAFASVLLSLFRRFAMYEIYFICDFIFFPSFNIQIHSKL